MFNVKELLKRFIPCTLAVVILLTPVTSYSLDNDYIHDDFKVERYWSKVKSTTVGDGNEFSGIIKCIEDEENGCFYLYFRFFDYKLRPNSGDNITLNFTVTNQNKEYYFCIDKFGFTNKSDKNIDDYFEISYMFDEASSEQYSGNVFIGFEFKNKSDKSLTNYISCQYSCGNYTRHTLFTDKKLDMSSQEVEKETTKNSNSQKTTAKSSENNSNNKESKINGTTKFSGSGTINSSNDTNNDSNNSSGKFSGGNGTNNINQNNDTGYTDNFNPDTQNNSNGTFGNQAVISYSNERTTPVKIMIIASAFIISCGAICVIAGVFSQLKSKNNEIPEEKETE